MAPRSCDTEACTNVRTFGARAFLMWIWKIVSSMVASSNQATNQSISTTYVALIYYLSAPCDEPTPFALASISRVEIIILLRFYHPNLPFLGRPFGGNTFSVSAAVFVFIWTSLKLSIIDGMTSNATTPTVEPWHDCATDPGVLSRFIDVSWPSIWQWSQGMCRFRQSSKASRLWYTRRCYWQVFCW